MAIQNNFPAIVPSLSLDFASVQALDPRITFSRASTATYYGTETAKAEENLFLRSQELDNAAWIKDNVTITANSTTAPDGTTTAGTMAVTAAGTQSRARQVPATLSGTNTISVFAKAGTKTFIQICDNISPTAFANFNLSTGVVGSTAGGVVASMSSAGNDWYRCVVTFTWLSEISFHIVDSSTSARREAPATTGDLFLWGAQAENRSAATNYTPTTTQPITNFIPVLESEASGVARFDHNPTTFESLGLLIEESRTNLLLRSEEFDNAGWSKVRSSIVANTIVAPSGELTGDKLVENTDNNTHTISQSVTLTAAASTISFYAKAGGRNFVSVINNTISNAAANFDLSNGTLGTIAAAATASIQSVGNGWHRCSMTFTAAAGTNQFLIRLGSADNSPSYTGDGFSGIFIWGASLEQGAFSTSYIPTVASQVTRAADAASMTGANFSSWYNQAAGTFYAEAAGKNTTNGRIYSVSDGTTTNRIMSFYNGNFVQNTLTNAGASQASFATAIANASVANKSALAYAFNDVAGTANASNVSTDTSANIPVVTLLRIGIGEAGTENIINGTIRKLSYYPQRLSNTNLQALTS